VCDRGCWWGKGGCADASAQNLEKSQPNTLHPHRPSALSPHSAPPSPWASQPSVERKNQAIQAIRGGSGLPPKDRFEAQECWNLRESAGPIAQSNLYARPFQPLGDPQRGVLGRAVELGREGSGMIGKKWPIHAYSD
jgi:hypothetical protein